jgi:FG-GAP-like repeat/Secretion system C-terminal sorting domain
MRKVIMCFVMLLLASTAHAQEWSVHTIGYNYYGASSTFAADIDSDGDLDILTTGSLVGGGVDWWSMDGDYWTRNVLTSEPGYAYAFATDIDTDGDLDVVALKFFSASVVLFEQQDGLWAETVIASGGGPAYAVASDIDQDGDVDLVISYYLDGNLVLLKQEGGSWTPSVLAASGGPQQSAVADLDGDGDLDVACSELSNSNVYWMENLGGANSWQSHTILDSYIYAFGLLAADHDGDGDIDLFAGSQGQTFDGGQVSYLANEGTGTFSVEGVVQVPYVRDLAHGDIDNGGTADLICSTETGSARWYCAENEWAEHSLPGSNHGSDLTLTDLDGDGDLDVVTAEQDNIHYPYGAIRWWEQVGTPYPVHLTLLPHDAPVIIPAEGGTITYDVHLVSMLPSMVSGLRYWTTIMTPDNQTVGPLSSIPFTMQPFMDITVTDFDQTIPADALAGTYMFIGHAGLFTNPMFQISDDFTFTKLGAIGGTNTFYDLDKWTASGEFHSSEGEVLNLPQQFRIREVFPNPFNANATVTVELPQSATLRLHLVNLLGQTVANVHSGSMIAGRHHFSIDGAGMSSGVYFLVGQLGEDVVSKKLVVLK